MKGLKQKKQATLERQKIGKLASTPPAPFLSPTHTLRYGSSEKLESKTISLENILQNGVEGDYASVQDAVRIPHHTSPEHVSVVPLPQLRGKSPSMSPPPIPRRGDHPNVNGYNDPDEIEEEEPPEGEDAMYATVQKTGTKKKSTGRHGYDRLKNTQDSLGYDHLLPHSDDSDTPIEAYATVDEQSHGEDQMYATVDNKARGKPLPPKSKPPPKVPPRRDSRLTSAPGPLDNHTNVDRAAPRGNSSSPKVTSRTPPPVAKSPLLTQQRIENGSALYSTVSKPATSKHKRHASADNLLSNQVHYSGGGVRFQPQPFHKKQYQPPAPTIAASGAGCDVAEMYATVQKPEPREKPASLTRRTVTPPDEGEPMYSVPDRKQKKPPPPIAPKPKGRQTPSPGPGNGE